MPSAGGAARQAAHQFRLVGLGEEGRQLENTLREHFVQRFSQMQVLNGYLNTEYSVNLALRIKHGYILLTNNYHTVVLLLCIANQRQHILLRDILAPNHFIAHETEGTVDGDVAVDQVLDGSQIGDDERRPACGDKHLMTVSLCLGERKNGRCGNLMGLETHQRAVNIEEHGILASRQLLILWIVKHHFYSTGRICSQNPNNSYFIRQR